MSFAGGKLKLKGGLTVKGGKIKKSKRSKKAIKSLDSSQALVETSDGVVLLPSIEDQDKRTVTEKKFEERLLKREVQTAKTQVLKSHREKVKEFNEYLASLTEHHDIPKVGPG